MTVQVSQKLTTIETIFKHLIWDRAIDAGFASLFASAPLLAVWPIGKILRDAADALGNYLFSGFTMVVDVTAIKLKNNELQSAYDKSSITLAVIAHDKGIESNEFINARDAARVALSKFTQFSR